MDPLTREQVITHLSALTDAEYAALATDARPPITPLQQQRAAMNSKSAALQGLRTEMDKRAAAAAAIDLPTVNPNPEAT